METHPNTPGESAKHDEDVLFERDKESAIVPLTEVLDPVSPTAGETTLPAKEDTLGNNDVKPLTEEEKQPKLPDEH